VPLRQDALGLADDVARGERGVQLVGALRFGQRDRGQRCEQRRDVLVVAGECRGALAVGAERPQALLVELQRHAEHATHLTPALLLSIVSALPKDPRSGRTVEPCLLVVLDGLRA
jgi:hypothetical protein